MNLHKKALLIITVAILIGSISLLYKSSGSIIHKKSNSATIINTPKTLKKDIVRPVYIHNSVGSLKNKKIPILMYHSICYEKGNILRIPREKFRNQMKYLKNNNYTTLSLDELYSYMKTGDRKSVV